MIAVRAEVLKANAIRRPRRPFVAHRAADIEILRYFPGEITVKVFVAIALR